MEFQYLYNPVLHSGITNIVKSNDSYYYGADGKQYIDLESGIWCASVGHNHPVINQIIKNQLDKLSHISKRVLPSDMDNIAQKILMLAGINGKIIFLNTGSEAIEFSLIISRLIHKDSQLISFENNYVTAYGQATKPDIKIDISNCLQCNKDICCTKCEVLKDKLTKNCIFIFDPFCFSRQILIPHKKLMQTVEEEIRNKKGIIIVDEITTGMGRTGKWFGFQHFKIKPDIIVLGKSLGNGYPVSAVMINENIIHKTEKTGFLYYQSHQNDPLGCKIAESVIHVIENENLIERSKQIGKEFLAHLQNQLKGIEVVKNIRGIGLLIGIELEKEVKAEKVAQELIKMGIIIGISVKFNMLNIIPSYTIKEDLLPEIAEKIGMAIQKIEVAQKNETGLRQLSYYRA